MKHLIEVVIYLKTKVLDACVYSVKYVCACVSVCLSVTQLFPSYYLLICVHSHICKFPKM
uniref:Uncharacterized protein n=1 Tax=Anguilla anguilla TaxID=7936 RepID=A0A0E9S073_ANGAN